MLARCTEAEYHNLKKGRVPAIFSAGMGAAWLTLHLSRLPGGEISAVM